MVNEGEHPDSHEESKNELLPAAIDQIELDIPPKNKTPDGYEDQKSELFSNLDKNAPLESLV